MLCPVERSRFITESLRVSFGWFSWCSVQWKSPEVFHWVLCFWCFRWLALRLCAALLSAHSGTGGGQLRPAHPSSACITSGRPLTLAGFPQLPVSPSWPLNASHRQGQSHCTAFLVTTVSVTLWAPSTVNWTFIRQNQTSPHQHHLCWIECWSDKAGHHPGLKIPCSVPAAALSDSTCYRSTWLYPHPDLTASRPIRLLHFAPLLLETESALSAGLRHRHHELATVMLSVTAVTKSFFIWLC